MHNLTTEPPASTTSSGSILVVDDNETTRLRIANVLGDNGYHVREATDGLDALRKASAEHFDAILLDLVLPNVDGWQFRATQLRHPELASIPTVIVTVQPLRQPDKYALRITDVVQKPFEDSALLQTIERACRTRQPVRSPTGVDTGGLFWSRRGEIACAVHAPDATSEQWLAERWAPIPNGAGNRRIIYHCEHCDGHGSPIDRSRRGPGRQGSTPRG
jgi:CheY-like chemotaxis protein